MPYTPNTTWRDGSGGGTPITAATLNHIETGLVSVAAVSDAAIPKPVAPVSNNGLLWNGSAWVAGNIVNANIDSAAAIAYSKLNLAGNIVNNDIAVGAALAPSKISGYPSDGSKFLAGDATWKNPTGTPATTLPGSPSDGQQAILTDSTTVPTYAWLLQWSSTASKWLFIGGSPAFSKVATSETTSSSTFADLATAGPSFTVPRAGVYLLGYGCEGSNNTANDTWACAPKIGAALAADVDRCLATIVSGTNVGVTLSRQKEFTCAASDLLKLQYRVAPAGTATLLERWLSVTPIAVT